MKRCRGLCFCALGKNRIRGGKALIVRSEQDLTLLLEAWEKSSVYAIDTETYDTGFVHELELVGVSLSFDGRTGFYVPVGHKTGETQLPVDYVLEKIKPLIEDPKRLAVMHSAVYDMKVLKIVGGIEFPEPRKGEETIFDTMRAAQLLDTESEVGLKAIAERYFDYKMTVLSKVAPKEKHPVTKDDVYRPDLVPINDFAPYSIDDAVQTNRFEVLFRHMIKEKGLEKIFFELEMPFLFVLLEMEIFGVKLDNTTLDGFKKDAPARIEELEKQIFALRPSGEPFNVNSYPQMNKVLFDELKIKPLGEKGKSGYYSTKEEYLDLWSNKHEICRLILDHRKLSKLTGTYLKGLTNRLDKDGRIRSSFRHVSTGRLSSSRPNLQNIPKPENDLFGLRNVFVAEDGYTFVVADYSQIELRVLAHFSQDPKMVEAYRRGEDIHALSAKELFDLEESVEEIKEKHRDLRSIAKNYNFAMVYEAGVQKLAAMTGTTQERAKELRSKYFNRFKGIQRYQQWMHHKAERDGYVKTIIGRYRNLPDAQLAGKTERENALKSGALRKASNTPIQGSAADIIEVAMRNIRWRLNDEGYTDWRFVLQIHDELIIEVRDDLVDEIKPLVVEEMESAVKLRVPIVVDVGVGRVWGEV